MSNIRDLESRKQRLERDLKTEKQAEEDAKTKEERQKTIVDKEQDQYEKVAEIRRTHSDKAIKLQEELNKLERQIADEQRKASNDNRLRGQSRAA